VAAWAARKNKKDCKQCEKLANPNAYAKGSRVRIAGVFDCKNCEKIKSKPISDNRNVLDLYNALPRRFDYSGIKVITAVDIKFIFELFEVPEELRSDYYQRIVFFHNALVDACVKTEKKESKRRDAIASWKQSKLPMKRRPMKTH